MMSAKKTIFVIFILGMTSSCLKAPSEKIENGPQAAATEVQAAIANAWGTADPSSIGASEFMYLEQDQKISTMDPRLVYKESTQVLDRTVSGDDITYSLLLRTTAIDQNGSFKPETSSNQQIIVKNPASHPRIMTSQSPAFPDSIESLQKSMSEGKVGLFQSSSDGKVQETALGLQTVLSMFDACVKTPNWDVTCHNLSVSYGWSLPPVGVSSQPGCGGINNCQISFKKVAFDLVVNFPTEDGKSSRQEKVAYEMTISPDVPYLSRLTNFCYQGLVIASGQRILVKICNRVQNFYWTLPTTETKPATPLTN